MKPLVKWLSDNLSADGQARCIPVTEYLKARSDGNIELEHAFLSGLCLRSRVTKMTSANRLDDSHLLLINAIDGFRSAEVRVLDVACSAGVPTIELHEAFRSAGIHCLTYGTDIILSATFVRRRDGWGMLFDPDGSLLQVEYEKWASPWFWRRRDWVFRPSLSFRARRLVKTAIEEFRSAVGEPGEKFSVVSVSLLSSRAEKTPDVHFVQEDVLIPRISGQFEIIRVANFLNRNYFQPEMIRRITKALVGRLVDDGLLLVVRTHSDEPRNRGTLFRFEKGRLQRVAALNGGSEVAAVMENTLLPEPGGAFEVPR